MANYLLRKNETEKAIQQYKDIIERNPSKFFTKKHVFMEISENIFKIILIHMFK